MSLVPLERRGCLFSVVGRHGPNGCHELEGRRVVLPEEL